jgi:hypothetical protein
MEDDMKLYRGALLGAALALPLGAAALPTPAHAQNDLLGNIQRMLGGNNDEAARRAYEQGRADQAQAEQRAREREHARHEYGYDHRYREGRQFSEDRYGPPGDRYGYYNNGPYDHGSQGRPDYDYDHR